MSGSGISAAAIEAMKAAVGPKGWIEDTAEMAPYLVDERNRYHGQAPLVLRPASTEEVAALIRLCAEAGIGVVPQGGNTGLVGGAVPGEEGGEVVISLARLNRIRQVDPIDYTMTVEAGCVLADLQVAAAAADRLLPLSLAAEGSCQIGGNLSTNAGGTAVLRYGNARDLVLGLEVVLPDGEVWHGLRRLRKDNTGYDVKQLFLGAEGTLGIITAAVLKLYAQPVQSATALVALAEPAAATKLLARLRAASGDAVTSFEYLNRVCLDLVLEEIPGTADPFEARHDHYALVELTAGRARAALRELAEDVLGEAYESGEIGDAVVAASAAQAADLWRLRESIPEALKKAGGGVKHDVSVPVSRVPEFLETASAAVRSALPEARIASFGHLGDGNIHFNLTVPRGADPDGFRTSAEGMTPAIHDIAVGLDGSFSAEHGIGRLKRDDLRRYKSAVELRLMRALKQAFDPRGIMNPGKIL